MTALRTIDSAHDLELLNTQSGYHFFDRASMRFFRSRIGAFVGQSTDKRVAVLITSEQFSDHRGNVGPRCYSVRVFDVQRGDEPVTPYGFQAFASRSGALGAGRRFLNAYNALLWADGLRRDDYQHPDSLNSWCDREFPKRTGSEWGTA